MRKYSGKLNVWYNSRCSLYILLTIKDTFLKSLIETLTVQNLMRFTVLNTSTNTGDCVSSVQSLSHVRLSATPWIAARQASPSITNSRSSTKLISIESVMPSSHLILCHPLSLLPPIPPSIRVFSNESTLRMRWPKYWSFSFSIIPSKEHSGLISFRMDWLELLAVQGTLKSLLQHHSSNASILRHSSHFGLLHSPTLTSIHDHRKNHSLD